MADRPESTAKSARIKVFPHATTVSAAVAALVADEACSSATPLSARELAAAHRTAITNLGADPCAALLDNGSLTTTSGRDPGSRLGGLSRNGTSIFHAFGRDATKPGGFHAFMHCCGRAT